MGKSVIDRDVKERAEQPAGPPATRKAERRVQKALRKAARLQIKRERAEAKRKAKLARKGTGPFARRVTTLYIDDSGVKLVAAKGKIVKQAVTLPFEKGVVSGGVVGDPEALGTRIAALFSEKKVKKNRVIVALSGLHCLSRILTLPYVAPSLRGEAVKREAERELPIPLENVYLSWQAIGATRTDMKIFLVAYSKGVIDSVVQALHKAGIKPLFIDLAPLAIARAIGRKTAVAFDVREAEADIVIDVDGYPEVMRSLPLPAGSVDGLKLAIMKEELNRTVSYFRPSKPVGDLPIFAAGHGELPELFSSLSEELGRPVAPVSPGLIFGATAADGEYAVNAGLVMRAARLNGATSGGLNMDLLPEAYRKAALFSPRTLIMAGLVLAAGAVIAGGVLLANRVNAANSVARQLDAANSQMATLQSTQVAQIQARDALQSNLDALTKKQQLLGGALDGIAASQSELTQSLNSLISSQGNGLSLTDVTLHGGELSVSGTASGKAAIIDYSKAMQATGRYAEVVIASIASSGERGFQFEMILR